MKKSPLRIIRLSNQKKQDKKAHLDTFCHGHRTNSSTQTHQSDNQLLSEDNMTEMDLPKTA